MPTNEQLPDWEIPLGNHESWQAEYGITALYLNDVAAGALLDIPSDWEANDAVERVASGLRHLLQELWHLDLVRPVLAVCSFADGSPDKTKRRLGRLTWDDEWHRGDFALRLAETPEKAAELLFILMGDTMKELDENVRADRVGIRQVRDTFANRRTELDASSQPIDQTEGRLIDALLAELDRVNKLHTELQNAGVEPNLVATLTQWAAAEGGEP